MMPRTVWSRRGYGFLWNAADRLASALVHTWQSLGGDRRHMTMSFDLERLVRTELDRYRRRSREKIVRGGAERARERNRLAANGSPAVSASSLGQPAASAGRRADGVLGSQAPEKAVAGSRAVAERGM